MAAVSGEMPLDPPEGEKKLGEGEGMDPALEERVEVGVCVGVVDG